MKTWIQNHLGLYPQEIQKSLSFAILGFAWCFAATCGQILFDALFLEKIGASFLPQIYLATACVAFISSFCLIHALKTASLHNIYTFYISLYIVLYMVLTLWLFVQPEPPKAIWVFYRIASIIGYSVFATLFWSYADSYHNLQDVKKLYSAFFASVFLGAILAGVTISSLIALIGQKYLFLLITTILIFVVLCILKIKASYAVAHEEGVTDASKVGEIGFFAMIVKLFSTRFVLSLTLYSLVAEVLWNVTEFNYFSQFQIYFQNLDPINFSNDATLIEYIGMVRGGASLLNILIGFFIYGRAIKRFGVNLLVFLPFIVLLIIYIPWIGFSSLLISTLAYFAIEGVQRTFGDNNFHLLIHGVPGKIRISYRVIVASFLEPFAMFLAGGVLIVPFFNTHLLGLTLTLIALFACFLIKTYYPSAIFANLRRNSINFTKKAHSFLSKLSMKEKRVFANKFTKSQELQKEPATILFYLEYALHSSKKELIDQAIERLALLDDVWKMRAIRHLLKSPYKDHAKVLEIIAALAKTVSGQDQALLYAHLADKGLLDLSFAKALLQKKSLSLKKIGVLALHRATYPTIAAALRDKEMAYTQVKKWERSQKKEEILAAIESKEKIFSPSDIDFLTFYLKDVDEKIVHATIMALAPRIDKTMSYLKTQLIHIMQEAKNSDLRLKVISCLQKILDTQSLELFLSATIHLRPKEKRRAIMLLRSLGKATLPTLLQIVQKRSVDLRARLLAAKGLQQIALPLLQRHLEKIVIQELSYAFFYFYFSKTVKIRSSFLDETTARSFFEASFRHVIDFIIEILAIAGQIEEPELLVFGLRSKIEKTHSHAVESLEKSCPRKIFSLLEPLIDNRPVGEKIKQCLRYSPHLQKMGNKQMLKTLASSTMVMDQISFATIAKACNLPQWKRQVLAQLKHADTLYHHFALEILQPATHRISKS